MMENIKQPQEKQVAPNNSNSFSALYSYQSIINWEKVRPFSSQKCKVTFDWLKAPEVTSIKLRAAAMPGEAIRTDTYFSNEYGHSRKNKH
jgi:hypothetical protein